jgi:hypothetical protein
MGTVNTEQRPLFLNFDEFEYGAMVSECSCDGVMEKRNLRLFPELPVVTDVAVCNRCGAMWYGRIE